MDSHRFFSTQTRSAARRGLSWIPRTCALALAVVLVASTSLLVACVPPLSESVTVNAVSTKFIDKPREGVTSTLPVEPFQDARDATSPAVSNDAGVVTAGGEVGVVTASAVSSVLRKRGVHAPDTGGVTIAGEIRDWRVIVHPKVVSFSLESRAKILVRALDRQGKSLFEGEYQGSTIALEAYPRERRMQELLGKAMEIALKEMGEDKNLIAALSF